MSSQRTKLTSNVNDSKNTRMDIEGLAAGDARTDILAHMSRYNKVAELMLDLSKKLKRPIRVLDIGCGELYPLRVLYKAHVCKKSEVVASYIGVDIDGPMLERQKKYSASMLQIFNAKLVTQDLTTHPVLDIEPGSIDLFFSCEVIEHMKPEFIPVWLDEVDRLLAPDGVVYVSTPNHDGSNDKLPIDHVYEWGFEELKTELEKRWYLVSATGTFIQMPEFNRVNAKCQFIPAELVDAFKLRFDRFWLRNVLAAPYPQFSNNVAWTLLKRKPSA